MDRNFEIGKHEVTTRTCSNPNCTVEFLVQHGGQKSGSSPAVHVPYVGKQPLGYCSTRCLFEANGWNYDGITNPDEIYIPGYRDEYKAFIGIDPDDVRPKGYLAPSRIFNKNYPTLVMPKEVIINDS